jgi:hypothetical protein
MGIACYAVQCPGCNEKITLRLAVGHDERQPFFYVCGRCRAATKGTLVWNGDANTHLDLEAGSVLDSDDGCTQTIHINPEYPSVPDAADLSKIGGSAFLFHAQVLGVDKVVLFQGAVGKFDAFVRGGMAGAQAADGLLSQPRLAALRRRIEAAR